MNLQTRYFYNLEIDEHFRR